MWREIRGGSHELWVRLYDHATSSWGDAEEATSDDYVAIQGQFIEYDRVNGEPMIVF